MTLLQLVAALDGGLATRRPLAEPLRLAQEDLRQVGKVPDEVISLALRLYDPCLAPGALATLWPVTRLILMTVAARLGAPRETRRHLLHTLKRLAPALRRLGPPRAPRHGVAPLAAFHFAAWRERELVARALYALLAGPLHLRIRALEQGMLGRAEDFGPKLESNLYAYLWSARGFIHFGHPRQPMPARIKRELRMLGDPSVVATAVDAGLRRWQAAARRPLALSTIAQHEAHLQILHRIRAHAIIPRADGPHTTRQGRAPRVWIVRLEREPLAIDLAPTGRADVEAILREPPAEAAVDGELSVDYGRLIPRLGLDGRGAPVARATLTGRWQQAHATMGRLGLLTDPGTVPLAEIADALSQHLDKPLDDLSPAQVGPALEVLLATTYGLQAEQILIGRGVRTPRRDGTVTLDLDSRNLRCPLPRVGYLGPRSNILDEACLPGSEWADVALPPALLYLAERYTLIWRSGRRRLLPLR